MQRDMELIRKILFKIEEMVDNTAKYNIKIDGYTMDQIAYHCAILYEGGYVFNYKVQYSDNKVHYFEVGRLTWEGHEFLDKIREESIWNDTKNAIKEKGLPLVFDIVKSMSTGIITQVINSYLGM